MTKLKLNDKSRAQLTTMVFLVVSLVFGSSASILSPTNGSLGALFGTFFSFAVLLGPLFYIRINDIHVKRPKPLYITPSGWILVPISFIASILMFLTYIMILTLFSLETIFDESNRETFIQNAVLAIIILTSSFGPITIYAVYIYTHYKKIISYKSPEWKKIKAKGLKNGQ